MPPEDSTALPSPAPTPAARLARLRDLAAIALLVAAAAFNYLALRHYVFEDAYITFRYAAHLAAGDGFVFQPGERVLGTSTPLFALLLGLLGALGLDIPAAGGVVFALALSACGALGWRLLARRGAPNAGVCFALAAVSGASGVLAFFGMELSLHLALIFLAAYLAGEEKPVGTGVALGLVCLNRYDGVMAVAAVLLTLWLRRRRLPWKEALISGAIFGAWLLFAQLYFGGPLPNTYAAKADDVGFARYATGALEVQGRTLLRPLYRLEPPLRLWPSLWQQVVIALALPLLWRTGAALAALLRRLRAGRRGAGADSSAGPAAAGPAGLDLAPLAFFAVFLWLGYSYIGPPLEHQWYLIPASYCLLALSFAAWARLLRRVPAALAAGGALLATLATGIFLPWAVGREAALMTSVTFGSDRIEAYEDMARFARHHGLENTAVLTYEPGYLTYLSGQRAIDAAGLVTKNVYYHGPSGRRSNLYELLEKTKPEMAVLGSPVMHEPGIREQRYQLALLAAPSRHLWIRRDFFLENLDRLYDAWQRGDYYPGRQVRLHHPFAVDFGRPELPFWQRDAEIAVVEGLAAEGFGERPGGEKLMTTRGHLGPAAAWSFPFTIDFDQLEFLFSANHEFLTAAQIYVDGLLAYEVVGRQQPGGPAEPGPLERIEVPLHAWRGRTGMLVFVSAEGDKGFFAADRVASRIYPRSRPFDDFEAGSYDPAIWEKGFAAAPLDNKKIAAVAGLAAVQGRYAAASLFAPGQQVMESRPFLIDGRRLSFTVFDFGDGRTKIELRVDGQRKHFYAGRNSRRVDLVSWDLSALEGREAVLILRDEDEAPERGIGIDSILLHD